MLLVHDLNQPRGGAALIDLLRLPENSAERLRSASVCSRVSEVTRELVKCMRASTPILDMVKARQRELLIDPLDAANYVLRSFSSGPGRWRQGNVFSVISNFAAALWLLTSVAGCYSDGDAAADHAERAVAALVKSAALLAAHASSYRSAATALNQVVSAMWCIASVSPVRKAVLMPVIDDLAKGLLPLECVESVAALGRYLSTGSVARCQQLLDSGLLDFICNPSNTLYGAMSSAATLTNVFWVLHDDAKSGAAVSDCSRYSRHIQVMVFRHVREFSELRKEFAAWRDSWRPTYARDDGRTASILTEFRRTIDAEVRALILLLLRDGALSATILDLLLQYDSAEKPDDDVFYPSLRTMLEFRRAHFIRPTTPRGLRGSKLAAVLRIDLVRASSLLHQQHPLQRFHGIPEGQNIAPMCDGCLAVSSRGARCAECSFDLCVACCNLLKLIGIVQT